MMYYNIYKIFAFEVLRFYLLNSITICNFDYENE